MRTGLDRLGREVPTARGNRMCLEKRQFLTRNAARDFSIKGVKNYANAPQEPYRCGLCGKFHLTTIKKAGK